MTANLCFGKFVKDFCSLGKHRTLLKGNEEIVTDAFTQHPSIAKIGKGKRNTFTVNSTPACLLLIPLCFSTAGEKC